MHLPRVTVMVAALLLAATSVQADAEADRWACVEAPSPETGIAACTRLITSCSLNPYEGSVAYYNRAVAYERLGKLDLAIADHGQAAKLDPKNWKAFYNRGNIYRRTGRNRKAIRDYDRAIALNPRLFQAYGNRGNAYRDRGRYRRAIADYDAVIRLRPKDPMAFYNRGLAHERAGRRDAAVRDYKTALRHDRGFMPAREALKRLATER